MVGIYYEINCEVVLLSRNGWMLMFVGLLVFVFCYMWSFVRYVGVYYTLGLLDCARYDEDFIISRFFPIHFTVTLAGLKSIVRHTEDFVI